LPSTRSKRVTGLGYGRRFESLINPAMMASPPPTRYTLTSAFGGRSPPSRAFSFGIARDHYKKVYIKENEYTDPIVPGPGTYDLNSEKKLHEGLKYSLRPKTTKDSSYQNFTKGFPGPGTYELSATEDKSGFCFISKFKSSTGTKFNAISQGNLAAS
jgi:Sperm-tail PG-rich repeat